jgi:hypothetical protein
MIFKAKLSKHGNEISIYIPKKVYTLLEIGKEYEWNVYTGKEDTIMPNVKKEENGTIGRKLVFDKTKGIYK